MKRLIHVATLAMVFATALAVPAMADEPLTLTDSMIGPGVNPCDGSVHEVTLNVEVSIHQHQHSGLFHVGYSGTTDSGFTLIGGQENATRTNNVVRGTFLFQWRHPDGSKFVEHGRFVVNMNRGEMLVDQLSSSCIGST